MNPKQTTYFFFATTSALLNWVVPFSNFQFVLFFLLGILWMIFLQKSLSKQEVYIFRIVLSEVLGIITGSCVFYLLWYLSQTPAVRNSDWLVGLMWGGFALLIHTVSSTIGIISYNIISALIKKRYA